MALTDAQTAELARIDAQITRYELILDTTDGLGGSHSDLGQTATYSTAQTERAERSLPYLRQAKAKLEALRDGNALPMNPYVNRGYLR